MAYAFNDDKSKYDMTTLLNTVDDLTATVATKTVTLTNPTGVTSSNKQTIFTRLGNLVMMRFIMVGSLAATNTNYTFTDARPSGYTPEQTLQLSVVVINGANVLGSAKLTQDGTSIKLTSNYKSTAEYTATVMYYTTDPMPIS